MIITADTIRRFPFAVAPHRITDDLQILIAQDMAAQSQREGQRPAIPKKIKDDTNPRHHAQMRVNQMVLDFLASEGSKPISAIRYGIGRDHPTVTAALKRLIRSGDVVMHKGRRNNSAVYSIPDQREVAA